MISYKCGPQRWRGKTRGGRGQGTEISLHGLDVWQKGGTRTSPRERVSSRTCCPARPCQTARRDRFSKVPLFFQLQVIERPIVERTIIIQPGSLGDGRHVLPRYEKNPGHGNKIYTVNTWCSMGYYYTIYTLGGVNRSALTPRTPCATQRPRARRAPLESRGGRSVALLALADCACRRESNNSKARETLQLNRGLLREDKKSICLQCVRGCGGNCEKKTLRRAAELFIDGFIMIMAIIE